MVLALETSTGCILGGDALSTHKERNDPSEVALSAVNHMMKSWNERGCVDESLQDQLIVFMALAQGKSEILCGPISLHTRTAIMCAEKLTSARFSIAEHRLPDEEKNDSLFVLSCDGAGHVNQNYST